MEMNTENPIKSIVSFPEGTSSFGFQVGGHVHGEGRLKSGVLKHKNGYLVKPLNEDSRADVELSFYKTVHENSDKDPLLEKLQSFIPKYHGVWNTILDGKEVKYLCIEDLCANFQNPSILDVKMGRITYDDDASDCKKDYEISKFSYGQAAGIRLVGMKIYNDTLKKYETQGKKTLRNLKLAELSSGLEMYLSKNVQINIWFLCGMIHKLDIIREWFSLQRRYRFIASSILLVYEGTYTAWFSWAQEQNIPFQNEVYSAYNQTSKTKKCRLCGEIEEICSKVVNSPLIRVSMIDFGHARPNDEIDSNYLPGIQNLVNYFKHLLNDRQELYESNVDTVINTV